MGEFWYKNNALVIIRHPVWFVTTFFRILKRELKKASTPAEHINNKRED